MIYDVRFFVNGFDLCDAGGVEYSMTKQLLTWLIDQRHDEEDMKRIIQLL